jgi:hypothetical protein
MHHIERNISALHKHPLKLNEKRNLLLAKDYTLLADIEQQAHAHFMAVDVARPPERLKLSSSRSEVTKAHTSVRNGIAHAGRKTNPRQLDRLAPENPSLMIVTLAEVEAPTAPPVEMHPAELDHT